MQQIQEIVNLKIQSMIDENIIQKTIEDNVEKAISEAISTQFRSYGSITKQIEEAIEQGLKINVTDMPFEVYNQQMLVAVKTKLGNLFAADASNKFMAEIEKTLSPTPSEMSAKELVESIAAFWKTDEPWNASELDDYATVELIESENGRDSHTLKMWKQKESGRSYSSHTNRPELQLYIIDGKIRISHNQSYNPTCFHEHEALIFKLYSAGTVITGIDDFDEDDCDLTLKESEY